MKPSCNRLNIARHLTALPLGGRTTYQGYLFVIGVPLRDSGKRNHPITPMVDSNLLSLMDGQAQGAAGLVPLEVIERDAESGG